MAALRQHWPTFRGGMNPHCRSWQKAVRRLLAIALLAELLLPSVAAARTFSHTRPAVNITHIFCGEINRRGKPVGFHARPGGRDPRTAHVLKIVAAPNSAGVYTAKVEIWDARRRRWKEKFSTFFPDRMDRQAVIDAILYAWRRRGSDRKRSWRGPSGRGFIIQGYLGRYGDIMTAFPIYRKD